MPEFREAGVSSQRADLGALPEPPPREDLSGRMKAALEHYPCDILFVHRDAERRPMAERVKEILDAASAAGISDLVPVVPVRMTEAWLLIDEAAIRRAAGNPNGQVGILLPPVRDLDQLPHPEEVLRGLLVNASEKTGRHLRRFHRDLHDRVQRVAELIPDFAVLRVLPAFVAFESATRDAVMRLST
jgi:hypothetical protein